MKGNNKYKFMAMTAFIFLLPFIILSRHFVSGNKELEKRDTLAYMELRTRTVANIAADLLTLNYDVSWFSSSAGFLNASGEGRKKILEGRINENPSIYSEFSILNASGKEVLKTGPGSSKDLKDYSKTALFKSAVDEQEPSGIGEERALDNDPRHRGHDDERHDPGFGQLDVITHGKAHGSRRPGSQRG